MNKVNYIFNLIKAHSLEIVSITETWLTSSCSTSFVSLPGFSFLRGDVVGVVRKHGAGLYVSNDLKHIQIDVPIPNVVVVHLVDLELYVLSVYRPPSYNAEENLALLTFLSGFMPSKEVLLLGDFNLPSLRWSTEFALDSYISPTDSLFYDCFIECGLSQWVSFGTFFPSGNILDLILTSDEDRVGEVYSCPPLPGCHHCPVICSVIFQFRLEEDALISEEKLSWGRADFQSISEDLMEVDWELAFAGRDIDFCYDYFVQVIADSVELHVPYRSAPQLGRWLSRPPREIQNERQRLWAVYKAVRQRFGRSSTEAVDALAEYSDTNNIYRNYSRYRQGMHEQKLANLIPEAPKLFHSYLRERKKGCPSVGPLRAADGSLTHDNEGMSEEFAGSFSAVYNASFPINPHPNQVCDGTMDSITVTYEMVHAVLEALSTSTSPGPDGIHPAILKGCSSAISLPLTLIIQKSLTDGVLPREWKRSRVIPIFKGGSRCTPLNYRPVSLTSCCCKVTERILSAHIYEYLQQNSLLSSRQF